MVPPLKLMPIAVAVRPRTYFIFTAYGLRPDIRADVRKRQKEQKLYVVK